MSIRGALVKFGVFAVAMMLVAVGLIVVLGQVRFDSGVGYRALFSNVSGLRSGEFVRIAGVEVGKVTDVRVKDGTHAEVGFSLDKEVRIQQSTQAAVRWANLIGDHYLELKPAEDNSPRLVSNGLIPQSQTESALDLDALLGGFKPLLRAMDPDQVNRLTSELVTVFQGQGGSIANVLQQIGQLTNALADRDQLIGSVITNLNSVLKTVDKHDQQLSSGIDNLQTLVSNLAQQADPFADSIAHINDASATLTTLLGQARPDISADVHQLNRFSEQFSSDIPFVDQQLVQLPKVYKQLTRLGLYGDFFSFYMCDVQLKVNGPNGDPVYIPVVGQRAGRCTPQ